MRFSRLGFIFLALYLVFLGGSAYYTLIFPVRVFHHILLTVLLAVWLIGRIRKGRGLPSTPLNYPLYAAILLWFASAVFSLNPRMALEHVWFLVIHVLFFFALADMFQRGRQRLIFETQFLLAALVVLMSALEVASWYFGLGFIPGTSVGWTEVGVWLPPTAPRLALAMNISTLLAGYVAPLVTLTGAWALTVRGRDFRAVLWILAGALFVVLLLTFSRGGLLSLVAAAGTLIGLRVWQSPRLLQNRPARALIGGGIAVALVGLIAVVVIVSLRPSRSTGDAGRVDMWRSAISMTRDFPVLGVGPGLFGRAFRADRDASIAQDKLASAHNIYLNTAAETGLVGIAVSVWLGATFMRAWWRNRSAATHGRRLRLEAAFSALVGIGVHSLVDAFTITPIVLMIAMLAAYCVINGAPRPTTAVSASTPRWTALVALLIVLAYGAWFAVIDSAHSIYRSSLAGGEGALTNAELAHQLDPALNLYQLQTAYLRGQQAGTSPEALLEAIAAYEIAITLEPTWDVGWINLAALRERNGDIAGTLAALDTARHINAYNPASLHWARIAEEQDAASEAEIIAAYVQALRYRPFTSLSPFWWATDRRSAAVESIISEAPLEYQYYILAAHDPARAAALVPESPQSADEWWVVGQYMLAIDSNAAGALAAFNEAVQRAPDNGDYLVSRSRALLTVDPTNIAAIEHDLDLAQLLGTTYEYPNLVRIALTDDAAEIRRLQAGALTPRGITQEFAGVLFGREAVFDIMPEMRWPGPGRAAMSPWYDLAASYAAEGNAQQAANVYRAILDYAPDETEARTLLDALGE